MEKSPMQTQSPLARYLHSDSDQNSELSSRAGDRGLTILDADNDDFISIPSGSRNSSGPTTGTGGSTGTVLSSTSDSTSPFVINITWDASVSSAPVGFTAGVVKAVQFLESQFSNPVTITIDVGYGKVDGMSLGASTLGQSVVNPTSVSYSMLLSTLRAHATTPADQSAVATLPSISGFGAICWAAYRPGQIRCV
jgi:hypothetical protein